MNELLLQITPLFYNNMKCLSKKISLTFILLLTSLLCSAQDIKQYGLTISRGIHNT